MTQKRRYEKPQIVRFVQTETMLGIECIIGLQPTYPPQESACVGRNESKQPVGPLS